ncbi:MAG: hypothetical protein QXO98_01930 [Sulfolobales archaeon]
MSGIHIRLSKTPENLENAIKGEEFEFIETHPAYIERVKYRGEKEAELSFCTTKAIEILKSKLRASVKALRDSK